MVLLVLVFHPKDLDYGVFSLICRMKSLVALVVFI